jgi:predicted MPP superfamily phosphohydrolase
VYIVGLDDNYLFYDNIFKAMNNVPASSPKILLAHAPNIIDKIDVKGINLILSGHTHGGQINIPFIGALYLNPVSWSQRKIVAGLYNFETKVFVSKGVGTTLIPMMLFCRPEIVVLEFVR